MSGSNSADTVSARGRRSWHRIGAKRRARSITPDAMASGPTDGTTPPSTATAGHSARQRGHRGAGQGVGAAAGKADDAEALGAERVGDVRTCRRPVGHRRVRMRVGQARARRAPRRRRAGRASRRRGGRAAGIGVARPACRGTTAPDRADGVAELGVAESAAVGQVEATLGARLFDARYAERVPHRVGHPNLPPWGVDRSQAGAVCSGIRAGC